MNITTLTFIIITILLLKEIITMKKINLLNMTIEEMEITVHGADKVLR